MMRIGDGRELEMVPAKGSDAWADDVGTAQLWAMTIEDPPLPIDELESFLSPDERARADRMHRLEDRTRSILARAGLRAILASRLGRPPDRLSFQYRPRGKPVLESADGLDLAFNVSHSGTWVLVGIAEHARLGVDVERVRPLIASEKIARRYFSAAEAHAIHSGTDDSCRIDRFFACWTRKEAYVKAIGGGLSMGLGDFVVTVADDEAPALVEIGGSQEVAEAWTLWAGAPAPGYHAAMAIDRPHAIVSSRYWLGSAGVLPWPRSAG